MPLAIDGIPPTAGHALLERTGGFITVGEARFIYRIEAGGLLRLTIPDDGSIWTHNGRAVPGGWSFRLDRSVARLTRQVTGATAVILIRRE
jgi:hypothetical protein